jgi:hypothetical protein
MTISGYSIGGYWCSLMAIMLMAIGDNVFNVYWWLLYYKLLLVINGCSWLFVDILLVDICGY